MKEAQRLTTTERVVALDAMRYDAMMLPRHVAVSLALISTRLFVHVVN
jgi:hypothetical protein